MNSWISLLASQPVYVFYFFLKKKSQALKIITGFIAIQEQEQTENNNYN